MSTRYNLLTTLISLCFHNCVIRVLLQLWRLQFCIQWNLRPQWNPHWLDQLICQLRTFQSLCKSPGMFELNRCTKQNPLPNYAFLPDYLITFFFIGIRIYQFVFSDFLSVGDLFFVLLIWSIFVLKWLAYCSPLPKVWDGFYICLLSLRYAFFVLWLLSISMWTTNIWIVFWNNSVKMVMLEEAAVILINS
jgi:hypothetical protein